MKKWMIILSGFLVLGIFLYWGQNHFKIGQVIDNLNGVKVYYNGSMRHVEGRNLTRDGYNLGLKYQCVEFVKRYYYERLHHKMPNANGNAKDFFDPHIQDGRLNANRGLLQFTNPSRSKPKPDDLVVLRGSSHNSFGHVGIISKVTENSIEMVQQNTGWNSRATYSLRLEDNKWRIDSPRILGWLRMVSK